MGVLIQARKGGYMRVDGRARRTKMAPPDNLNEPRLPAGRIAIPRIQPIAPIALLVHQSQIAREFHPILCISNR
jgi:hypothetical protein